MTIMELGTKFKKIFGFNPPIDIVLTAIKGPTHACLDIIKLDHEFDRRDPDYNSEKCTYKGEKGYSISLYVKRKFGEDAEKFLRDNM